MTHSGSTTCTAIEKGVGCPAPTTPGCPLSLCTDHLLAAHEWVTAGTGVTDLLPSPCRACGSPLGVRFPSGWMCAVCEWRVGDEPDGEPAAPRVDVVYYLGFLDRIKIGTTANPRQRLAALRFDELLAFERGDRLVEQRRHRQFAIGRLGTSEWFELDDALRSHIAELRAGVDDPWARYARWVSSGVARRG